MRHLTVLLVLVAFIILGIVAALTADNHSSLVVKAVKQQSVSHVPDSAGTIDGAKNPEKIPDHVAYSLLFDLIAERETEVEQKRIRSYLRQIGLGTADSEALIAAAEEYRQRDNIFGFEADQIKARNHPNHLPLANEDKKKLKQLQKQHESTVKDVIASLPSRLSADGLSIVRQHVKERVKRKTKMSADRENDPNAR